jgi:ketosteroid isomerase-like protein
LAENELSIQANDKRAEDVAALQHIAREFAAGFNTGDVDRIMRFYGDVYVDVNLRNPVQSKEERRKYYEQVMRRGLRVKVRPDEIRFEGELGLVRGTIELTVEGKVTELRYLEVARKQPDGSWKVIWGMDGPVQEYAPSTDS